MKARELLYVVPLLCAAGLAEADEAKGFFIEGRYGQSDLMNTFSEMHQDHQPVGWLAGGYWFNKYFAVEGGYVELNDAVYDSQRTSLDTIYAGVKGRMLFERAEGTGFFLGGRAGLHHWDQRDHNYDQDGVSRYVGAFVGYQFTPSIALSLNYDFFHAGRSDASATTLGFEYKF